MKRTLTTQLWFVSAILSAAALAAATALLSTPAVASGHGLQTLYEPAVPALDFYTVVREPL